MANNLDPRIHAYRNDLADIALQEHVEARRFVSAMPGVIISPIANVYSRPDTTSTMVTQGLMGEAVHIFETRDGFHWLQFLHDQYVGYVPVHDVDHGPRNFSHQITARLAHIFSKPDVKSAPLELLPYGAYLNAIGSQQDEWLSLARGGYTKQTAFKQNSYTDLASAAASFMRAPYLWGGRSALGIDCSGLVQIAMQMLGKTAPRDSDQQAEVIGSTLTEKEMLHRNDLIFFKGHVGVMWDETDLLHANAYSMNVTIEPLAEVEKRAVITLRKRLQT
jgi:cell wall-associated NlpC family hydrolase